MRPPINSVPFLIPRRVCRIGPKQVNGGHALFQNEQQNHGIREEQIKGTAHFEIISVFSAALWPPKCNEPVCGDENDRNVVEKEEYHQHSLVRCAWNNFTVNAFVFSGADALSAAVAGYSVNRTPIAYTVYVRCHDVIDDRSLRSSHYVLDFAYFHISFLFRISKLEKIMYFHF